MNVIKTYWPLFFLVLLFSLFYLTYIPFYTADLGRHIVNGRGMVAGGLAGFLYSGKIFHTGAILKTNYYSFTQTDFPFVNHHWLFGVIVFYLHKVGGFSLLTWFNTILNTLAFIFVLLTALKSTGKSKVVVSVITAIGFLFLPLFAHRTEIRPESLSLLFFAYYYFLFHSFKTETTLSGIIKKNKLLIILVLTLQIIWTNSHLFFILGPLLAGYFLFERILILLFREVDKLHQFSKAILKLLKIFVSDSLIKLWLVLFVSLYVVGIINPNGIQGLLIPLKIFDNYAYRVAENQSTFFMINYGSQVMLFIYVVICSFIALLLGGFSLLRKKGSNTNYDAKIAQFFLIAIFAILANKINRLTPFFAVIAIPFIVQNLLPLIANFWNKYKEKLQNSIAMLLSSTLFFILIFFILKTRLFFPHIETIGTGLPPGIQNAAHFFIQNNLHGPIFNNYDIGGYLAYNLFPKEKLFIDNRPEAYSAEFLTNEYLLSLTDENVWNKISDTYNLNVIFFYRHDQIDGAQQFLYNRVTDPNWVPVYVDDYALILVKNSELNTEIIKKFKLPDTLFVMNAN